MHMCTNMQAAIPPRHKSTTGSSTLAAPDSLSTAPVHTTLPQRAATSTEEGGTKGSGNNSSANVGVRVHSRFKHLHLHMHASTR